VIKIDSKIVGQEIADTSSMLPEIESDPRTRKPSRIKRVDGSPLEGWTYALKWPHNKRTLYMTCNFIRDDKDRKIPLEIFFEGGDAHMLDVLKVISRQTSSILQRSGDVLYTIKDFIKNESSQQAWVQPSGYQHSINVPSLAALIGYTLIDFFYRCEYPGLVDMCDALRITKHSGINALKASDPIHAMTPEEVVRMVVADMGIPSSKEVCPECKGEMDMSGACPICRDCGYSKCG
jgi:hypothetical protein